MTLCDIYGYIWIFLWIFFMNLDIKNIVITPKMLNIISEIDEFKGSWRSYKNLAPERLNDLKHVATIESVASSTRIEGSKLSDMQVESLLINLEQKKFSTRDEQEVAGYANVMDEVFESYNSIPITENYIKQLHGILLKHCEKDERHKGDYKKLSNNVAAFDVSGNEIGIIFETTSPFDTPQEMEHLIKWVNKELENNEIHPLIVIAIFIVTFLAIHPFQDGNGRLSRILTVLLLLKGGYSYVAYSSMESIIEANKERYYLALRKTQTTIKNVKPEWHYWIEFFLQLMKKQKNNLLKKVERERYFLESMPQISQDIIELVRSRGRITNAEIVMATGANRATIKKRLSDLVGSNQIRQNGKGKGTWYSMPIEGNEINTIKLHSNMNNTNQKLIITNGDYAAKRIEEFALANKVLPWRDVLHEGPVTFYQTLEEQSHERAKFISKFANISFNSVLQDFKDRDKILCEADLFSKIELWFEHDLYDQLQLIQIVDYINRTMPDKKLYLVQADNYLCDIPDALFVSFAKKEELITSKQKKYASTIWQAFTNNSPEMLNKLSEGEDVFPYMNQALKRLLQEYPDKKHGLPRSLYTAITPLLDKSKKIGELFDYMQREESAKFMGDIGFGNLINDLIVSDNPVINVTGNATPYGGNTEEFFKQKVELTKLGQEVLASNKNYVEVNGIDKWIGGVHITNRNLFFYDESTGRVDKYR